MIKCTDTQCPSFVQDNPIVCHSDPAGEESRHFLALIEPSNAEILRFALQKLDALLVSIEQIAPSTSDPSSACN